MDACGYAVGYFRGNRAWYFLLYGGLKQKIRSLLPFILFILTHYIMRAPRRCAVFRNIRVLLMTMLNLFYDAAAALRFRYKPAPLYRYGFGVFAAVALALGVVQAAELAPVLGAADKDVLIGFGLVAAVSRWLVLTRVMTAVMHYYGSPRIPFLGYTLATEALTLPRLLAFYLPKDLLPLVLFWNIWAFWAQAAGFIRISGQSGAKVLAGYLLYLVLWLVLLAVFVQMFVAAGWLDAEQILKAWEAQVQQVQ